MDISSKKNRSDLKSYFVKNNIPTESNFADLIDGMINQQDDRIAKLPDEPLSLEALGDFQKVINFYETFDNSPPAWSLQLLPHDSTNNTKAGLCIADGSANQPRLFIDKATGNIGIGTLDPISPLDIAQAPRISTHPKVVKGLYVTGDFGADSDGIEFRQTDGTQGIGFGANTIYAAGSNTVQVLQLKPKDGAALRVLGKTNLSSGNDVNDFSIENFMESGSLTIGSVSKSYGGQNGQVNNLAGLLLQTNGKTEIAVYHPGKRFSSLMYYEGGDAPVITIGRDMGWGATPVNMTLLDIAQVTRSGTHLATMKGFYVTGDFLEDQGVEFRQTDGTQGIGFGYNTIYAAGSNSDQDLNIKPKGNGKLQISGDLVVSGSIEDFSPDMSCTIELSGGSCDEKNEFRRELTYLKVNGNNIGQITQQQGINTVILTKDGNFKNSANHNVYDPTGDHYPPIFSRVWDQWAVWVNEQAATGDIVAVASYDAVSNALSTTEHYAGQFLMSIQALKAFNIVAYDHVNLTKPQAEAHRVPYVLLFVKDGNTSMEATSLANSSAAPAAKIITTYQSLLKKQWELVDLKNGWDNYGNEFNYAQYRKDKNGIVWLRGLIRGGTTPSNNNFVLLFTLPVGYRPANRQLHSVIFSEFAMGRVDILPDGSVALVQATNSIWLSLDGIAFSAAPFTSG